MSSTQKPGDSGFFLKYLRAHLTAIIAYALCCLIFAATFALYHLPMKAVLYPVVLSAMVCTGAAVYGYFRALGRHRTLCDIKKLTAATITSLPEAYGETDSDYADIIAMLRREAEDSQERALDRHRDTVDYYTVWAHQIKTPIASMRLTLQNEDSALSRRLSSELSRIEQYVDMVLAYLRLDSESGDYVFRKYDLDTILKRSVRRFSGDFIAKKIQLDYSPVGRTIVTDEKWLSFVIEQILSNALKYTPSGSVSIFMDGDILKIKDTGIGIAPEDLPRIFEKGYTGYNGRTDMHASGIGLYLCRRICENLSIAISAESKPGAGTTVMLDMSQYRLRAE